MIPTLSLVTTCMNRNDFLRQTLPTWLQSYMFDEIIVVDYSSKEKCVEIIQEYQNGKITLIEVPNQQFFNYGKANNTGLKYVTSEYVFIIDCDVKIIRNFDESFFDGACRQGGNGNVAGTNLIPLEAVRKINGYSEATYSCGTVDIDFFKRVRESGTKVYYGGLANYLSHIDHDNKLRAANYAIKDYRAACRATYRMFKKFKWGTHCTMEDMHESVYLPPMIRKKRRMSKLRGALSVNPIIPQIIVQDIKGAKPITVNKKPLLSNKFISMYVGVTKNKK